MAGTTFPEGLKSLLVYNIYGCVSKTIKFSMYVGVFVVVVLVVLKMFVKVGGGGAGGWGGGGGGGEWGRGGRRGGGRGGEMKGVEVPKVFDEFEKNRAGWPGTFSRLLINATNKTRSSPWKFKENGLGLLVASISLDVFCQKSRSSQNSSM